jgi:hypothetical protein
VMIPIGIRLFGRVTAKAIGGGYLPGTFSMKEMGEQRAV